MSKITATVIDVTPQMAADWLRENLENQRLALWTTIELYKGCMIRGEWKETGEAIIFDEKGKLLNGQHRLKAAVEAKHTIRSQVIVHGVKREAFDAMDTGRKRSAADVLTIAGHGTGEQRYVRVLGALASFAYLYKLGYSPVTAGKTAAIRLDGKQAPNIVTYAHILQFVDENPTTKSSCAKITDMQGFNRLVIPSSILAWCHYQGRKLDAALAEQFVHCMMTGEDMKKGDPILILRELLVEQQVSKRRHSKLDIMAGSVKCWNAKRLDDKIKPGDVFDRDWEKFPRFK